MSFLSCRRWMLFVVFFGLIVMGGIVVVNTPILWLFLKTNLIWMIIGGVLIFIWIFLFYLYWYFNSFRGVFFV